MAAGCSTPEEVEENWQCFLAEAATMGSKAAAEETVTKIIQHKKVAEILKRDIKKSKKRAAQEGINKALDYILRKKAMLGCYKKKKLADGDSKIKYDVCDGAACISPMKMIPSCFRDKKALEYIGGNFRRAELLDMASDEKGTEVAEFEDDIMTEADEPAAQEVMGEGFPPNLYIA